MMYSTCVRSTRPSFAVVVAVISSTDVDPPLRHTTTTTTTAAARHRERFLEIVDLATGSAEGAASAHGV
jgi:hypothetical protein